MNEQTPITPTLVKEIRFYFEKLAGAHALSRDFLTNWDVSITEALKTSANPLFNRIVLAVSCRVPTHTLAEHAFPVTWWDAVKERWFPAWAKRRWPVQKRTLRVKLLLGGFKIPQGMGSYTLAYMAEMDSQPLRVSGRDRMEEARDKGEFDLDRQEMDDYLSISPEDRKVLDEILDETNSDE